MSPILSYRLSRFGRTETAALCDVHVEARRVLGWKVGKGKPGRFVRYRDYDCEDCGAAKNTVLAAAIAEDDRVAPGEPQPVPVLPGQRDLFGGKP
jgi:hypothetical protein